MFAVNIGRFVFSLIRFILRVFRPFSDYFLHFVYVVIMGPTKKLSPIDQEIICIPAVELAEKIRKRQISSEEVMKAYIERSKSVHSIINAVTDERYDAALEDAKNVDRFLASGTKTEEDIEKDTPLLGIPFTCKEAIGVKDLLQTIGMPAFRNHVCDEDGAAPALYRKAGAIPLTVTNVPEFCLWWGTANRCFGPTRNPYDHTRTPGGSTGGECALITAGGALFGVGTDFAGSIRIPSSFCGVYGHKPSRGIVNNYGMLTYKLMPDKGKKRMEFVSTGPICRYVQDLPLLFRVLSENDQRLCLEKKVDFTKVSLYYIESFPGFLNAVVPEIKKCIHKAVKHFEEKFNIKAKKISFPELEESFTIWECKVMEQGGAPYKKYLAYKGDPTVNLWWEFLKNAFGLSNHTLPAIYCGMVARSPKDLSYDFYLKQYQSLEAKFNQILREDALLLVPTHPEPPPHYLTTMPLYPNIGYTSIFNLLGVPCTQIPSGLSRGVPIGLQAISGQFKDHICIAAASELDKVFGGWISPSPITAHSKIQ